MGESRWQHNITKLFLHFIVNYCLALMLKDSCPPRTSTPTPTRWDTSSPSSSLMKPRLQGELSVTKSLKHAETFIKYKPLLKPYLVMIIHLIMRSSSFPLNVFNPLKKFFLDKFFIRAQILRFLKPSNFDIEEEFFVAS